MKKNNFSQYNSFVILIVFVVALFLLLNNTSYLKNIKQVRISGEEIQVELALTQEERLQGLSNRTNLNPGSGMLFIFEQSGEHPFWMKEMNFPLDMIWINENMKVVYIKNNAQPNDYPQIYGKGYDAKYVLEVVADFIEQHNLKIGDSVRFIYR